MRGIYYVLFAQAKELASRIMGAKPAPIKRIGDILSVRRPDRKARGPCSRQPRAQAMKADGCFIVPMVVCL